MAQRFFASPRDSGAGQSRLRFELILASTLLATGLFLVPAGVYEVGKSLLGPYGDGVGLGTFYADFFGALASGTGRAWTLALGPLVLVSLLRLLFIRRPAEHMDEPDEPPRPSAVHAASRSSRRVEPRVSLDP